MTTVRHPLPAFDPESAEHLPADAFAEPLTLEGIGAMRAGNAALMTPEAELINDQRFSIDFELARVTTTGEVPVIFARLRSETGRPTPLIYYIHGGGFIAGSNRDALDSVLDLAAAVGASVASVDYRLAPEHPFPAGLDDCHGALEWLLDKAGEFGFDPHSVVILGGSAGGGLAAGLALRRRDERKSTLAGLMLMSPMLDDRNASDSARQMSTQRIWNQADNAVAWGAYLGDLRGQETPHHASPARASDLSGLPPTFIDVGSADTFRDEDVDFANRVWAAGGHAELHVWPGGFHGFDTFAPKALLSRSCVDARVDWLRRVLHAPNTAKRALTRVPDWVGEFGRPF